MAEARRVLGVGGRLLVSAPNRRYVQQTETAPSPEDKHEFTDEEFRAELAKFFPHVTTFLENESDAITFTPLEVCGVRTALESMKPQPEQADGFLAVGSTEPLYGSPAFVYLPWVGNVLYEREGRIDRLRTALEQTDLMLNATADQIKTLQLEYQQEQQRATEAVQKLEKENEEKTAWANQLQEKLDARTELEERTQWALKLKAEMDRAMENFRKLEADKDDVIRDLEKSVKLLDDAERRVIERTGWAQRLDRDLTKARETTSECVRVSGLPYRSAIGTGPQPRRGSVLRRKNRRSKKDKPRLSTTAGVFSRGFWCAALNERCFLGADHRVGLIPSNICCLSSANLWKRSYIEHSWTGTVGRPYALFVRNAG